MTNKPLHHLLWAKADNAGRFHPLICDLIDVAQVTEAPWDRALTDSIRGHFCSLLGLPPGESGRLRSFCIGLHDLGKAGPAFDADLVFLTVPRSLSASPDRAGGDTRCPVRGRRRISRPGPAARRMARICLRQSL